MDKKTNDKIIKRQKSLKEIGPYLNISSQLIAPILVGVGVGYWIDSKHETGNLWTLTLSVIGVLVGLYNFVKIVVETSKKKKDNTPDGK